MMSPFLGQVRRWHAHHHSQGTGPVYQGRFKSFPAPEDDHDFTLCRYVERHALCANRVPRAEQWRWCSLWQRCQATGLPWLHAGPLPWPQQWVQYVNQAETEAGLRPIRHSVFRGAPYGDESWQERAAQALRLESALRAPGRPGRHQPQDGKNLT